MSYIIELNEPRKPIADRSCVVFASIENARAALDNSRRQPLPERLAIALAELSKIIAAKDTHDRMAVKP